MPSRSINTKRVSRLTLVRWAKTWLIVVALTGPLPLGATSMFASSIVVKNVATTLTRDATEFVLDLSQGVPIEVFTLSDPYRVMIDLPKVTFQLPVDAGASGTGLISNYRFGAYANGRSRVVIATTGPVTIAQAIMSNNPKINASGVQLRLRLIPTDPEAFGASTGAARAAADLTKAAKWAKPSAFDDAIIVPSGETKPVVMIDPGHGGIDPGAVGAAKTLEKNVVLAVALQLKAALDATGRYDVRLTRMTDVFIPLDQRVQLSRQVNADIFVSLHADTIDDQSLAQAIRGVSIYTLSDRASNESSRLMAEKENAADLAAGMAAPTLGPGDDVKPILYDLMARETATFSHILSRSMVLAIGRRHPLAHEPERAAAFRVLKQPHAPSVLIELGFLSNSHEEQAMSQLTWQRGVAHAIADAIRAYFDQKTNQTATSTLSSVPYPANGAADVPGIAGFGGLPP